MADPRRRPALTRRLPSLRVLQTHALERRHRGQSLVEFTLVAPVLVVLLVVVADFGRLFATGISVESAARDAAEVAAQEYLQNPPTTPGDPTYYATIHQYAIDTVCRELETLPNAGYSSGVCTSIPMLVCVHDGEDPSCDSIAPAGTTPPPQCSTLAPAALPTNAQTGGSETSKYVEVRVCYRFSTLLNMTSISGLPVLSGDFYVERGRIFTVADY